MLKEKENEEVVELFCEVSNFCMTYTADIWTLKICVLLKKTFSFFWLDAIDFLSFEKEEGNRYEH